MGYIKEPECIDFIFQGKLLTEKAKRAICESIKADKETLSRQKNMQEENIIRKI
jgi:hypothetical protein